jgi:hypothetical protein
MGNRPTRYAPQQANDPQVPYGTWRMLGGSGLTGTQVITASGTGARITALTTSAVLDTTRGRIAIFARNGSNVIYIAYETARNAGTYLDWFPVSDARFRVIEAARHPVTVTFGVRGHAGLPVGLPRDRERWVMPHRT